MTERKPYQPPRSLADKAGGFIDRVMYAVAPERGLRRMAFRQAHARHLARDHEIRNSATDGGERTQTRDRTWLGKNLSPDSVLESDHETLRSRSRELYVNDSIGGAVDSRVNLVVSYGFTPQARIKERAGLATAEQAETWNAELEEVFERLYSRIGKNGKTSLWQLLRLVERHNAFDGESFTILSDRGAADKPIPLTLEVVDPERVQTPPGKINNPRVRLGVEYDAHGAIVAYHVRDTHPGDSIDFDQSFTRYPADRVLHVYEPWFAGQSRGFPWLTRVLNRLKDAKDLDEAAIISAQVEACFAGFVTSSVGGYQAATSAATATDGTRRYQDIHPGTISFGNIGEKIDFAQPTKSNGYEPVQNWNYRRAAAGMNYPFEMIAKNWGGLSFAAGRLSLTDVKLFCRSEQKLLRESWLAAVWNQMVLESVIIGETAGCSIPARLYSKAPWWFARHEWRDPSWPYALTPREEIDAAITAVDNNIRTKASLVGEYGGDWEEVAAERKKERDLERDTNIEPASAEVPEAELNAQRMAEAAA